MTHQIGLTARFPNLTARIRSSLSPPPDSPSPLTTTQLTVDCLRLLCRPVFEEERLNNHTIAWVGIYGSVQRGTQGHDSDVDFLVGYAAGADYFYNVCGSCMELQKRLLKIIGREVDLLEFIKDNYHYSSIHLEALLTAKTIWGDPSWVHSSREVAEHLLRERYKKTKKALQAASHLRKRLPSSQAEFESPENKALRLSILKDALLLIATVKKPNHPFYGEEQYMPWLLLREDAIRAAIEGEVETRSSKDIWNAISDPIDGIVLERIMREAKQTFSFAGLEP